VSRKTLERCGSRKIMAGCVFRKTMAVCVQEDPDRMWVQEDPGRMYVHEYPGRMCVQEDPSRMWVQEDPRLFRRTVHSTPCKRLRTFEWGLYGRPTTEGCAVAQAVSRRLPTAAVQVRAQVRLSPICGGQNGTGTGSLRLLRFPVPLILLPAPHSSSSIILGWYSGPNGGPRTERPQG
jgi:hypothetical protein